MVAVGISVNLSVLYLDTTGKLAKNISTFFLTSGELKVYSVFRHLCKKFLPAY